MSTSISSESFPFARRLQGTLRLGWTPRRLIVWLLIGLACVAICLALLWSIAGQASSIQNTHGAIAKARAEGIVRIGVDHRPAPPLPTDYEVRRDDGFQGVVGDNLSQAWNVPVELVEVAPQNRLAALTKGQVDALFVREDFSDPLNRQTETLDVGYQTALAPFMRNDTNIFSWQGLTGRNVCVAEGNEAAKSLALHYGATVTVASAPAKAFAATRTGGCDAALDDAEVIGRLIKQNMGRWDKFSATLPPVDWQHYVFVTMRGDLDSRDQLRDVIRRWRRDDQWMVWIRSWITDVDFETYLEQDGPDCH